MPKLTKEALLAQWCADRGLFSKADLHEYGWKNHYLRAWRTACDFVSEGRAKRLSEAECKERELTTSMAWYLWSGEPARTEQEEVTAENNLAQETAINRQAFEDNRGQLAFCK